MLVGGLGCAASMRPIVVSSREPGRHSEDSRIVATDQPMATTPTVSAGCYIYIGLINYTTPTAGAKEAASIARGGRYTACYEANDIGDYVYLTGAHPRRDIWLGIQRDGFVGEKGGWWFFLAAEGPRDYRATHLFQGHWGRSKWTTERLMVPAETRIMYEGRRGREIRLSCQVGAAAAGVPFTEAQSVGLDPAQTDVVSVCGFSFRILSADEGSITFIVVSEPGTGPRGGEAWPLPSYRPAPASCRVDRPERV